MTRAYLALGSNLGDRAAYLQGALDELAHTAGVRVVAVSRVYETVPVGGPAQDDYFNAVAAVDTDLDPWQLLAVAHACEAHARRVRAERFGPRTLDVDILLFGAVEMDDPALTIPHPRKWQRNFVLAPLHDVAPDLVEASDPGPDVRVSSVALEIPPAP